MQFIKNKKIPLLCTAILLFFVANRHYIRPLFSFGGLSDVRAVKQIKKAEASLKLPSNFSLIEVEWDDNSGYSGETLKKIYKVDKSVIETAKLFGWAEEDYYRGGWQDVAHGNPTYPLTVNDTHNGVRVRYDIWDNSSFNYYPGSRINRSAKPSYVIISFSSSHR